MSTGHYDAIVIGTGPGGEGATMKLAKAGRNIAVVERYESLGGGCTLNVELALLNGIITTPTNADGGAIFTIDVPANTAFCGGQLGFQYLWLDPANPSCPFQLTQGLAVTIGS